MSHFPRPTAEQLAVLSPFERFAFEVADLANRHPLFSWFARLFQKYVGAKWVHFCTRNLTHVEGLENLAKITPDRGVLLAVNHRSLFDCYVLSSILMRQTSWVKRIYFPVRSSYFYERLDGVLVNALMSAMAMYPPVMRAALKRSFNKYTVDTLAAQLRRPGTLVGMHPEGTRNKTPDPYQLLPAQPGIGELVIKANPVVLPAFILGLSNNFLGQIFGNFSGRLLIRFGHKVLVLRYLKRCAKIRGST